MAYWFHGIYGILVHDIITIVDPQPLLYCEHWLLHQQSWPKHTTASASKQMGCFWFKFWPHVGCCGLIYLDHRAVIMALAVRLADGHELECENLGMTERHLLIVLGNA